MSKLFSGLGALGLLIAAPAHALEELPPASNWTLDYAEDSCALQRDFGEGDDLVHLELRQFGPGNTFQAMIASDDYSMRSPLRRFSSAAPEIRYSPDAEAHRPVQYFRMRFGGRMRAVSYTDSLRESDDVMRNAFWDPNWSDETREQRENAIEFIDVTEIFMKDLRLQTGKMRTPMQALRTCLDELITHWGIDAEAHRNLSRPAVPQDMDVWSREIMDAYPREMAIAREMATLRIRLDVSKEGRATGCHLQKLVGEEGFEQTACDLLIDNARFLPAIDAQGELIDSFYVLSVHYRL